MGTVVAHGLLREVEAGAAGWGVVAGAGIVWVGVSGLVGMGGGRKGGSGDGIGTDGPEALGVHVAEEFLVDGDEVGTDGMIGFAQLGRAMLLVVANDQVAVEPAARLVGVGPVWVEFLLVAVVDVDDVFRTMRRDLCGNSKPGLPPGMP